MDKSKKGKWPVIRANLFRMVSVGVIDEPINQIYDVISIGAVVANLVVSVMSTFDKTDAAILPVTDTEGRLIGYINRTRMYAMYRKIVADFSQE